MDTYKDCRVGAHGSTVSIIGLSPGTGAEFTLLDEIVTLVDGLTAAAIWQPVGVLPVLLGVRVVIGGGSND